MVVKSVKKIFDEFGKAEGLLSVWVLIKDGDIAGRILARRTAKGVVHVSLIFYGKYTTNGEPILGYQRMTGYGYPKTNCGIADILAENRQKLFEAFNLTLAASEWNIMNTWERDLENCGFQVIQAL